MTSQEIATQYDGLPKEKQIAFLAQLVHELTLDTRGCYSATPQIVNSDPGSVVGNLNEMQHRVAGALRDVITNEQNEISGSGLIEWLMHWARRARLEQRLLEALASALSWAQRQ